MLDDTKLTAIIGRRAIRAVAHVVTISMQSRSGFDLRPVRAGFSGSAGCKVQLAVGAKRQQKLQKQRFRQSGEKVNVERYDISLPIRRDQWSAG